MTEQAVLEGVISIEAAIRAGTREIQHIYFQEGKRKRDQLRLDRLAQERHIPVEYASKDFIEQTATGKSHGGVVALVSPRTFVSLEALIQDKDIPFVVMLDGIEDPFNFGYTIRAFYAAGASGLVVRPRNWMTAAAVVARASAGATEWIPTAIADTALEAATFFRGHGLTIAGTAKENAVSIYQADLAIPLFLVIGGEKRGLTRSFRETVDLSLHIPYGRSFAQSLGTTAAAGALAFEIMRQRTRILLP
ncbi:MAG: RNA methyltransferase [Chloroflexota bacterium]